MGSTVRGLPRLHFWRATCRAVTLCCALVVLLNARPGALRGAEDERLLPSLAAAKQVAQQQDKPVLCAFLAPDSTASKSFERDLRSSKTLRPLLDEFVIVVVAPAAEPELVQRHNIKLTPSVLFMTPDGRPMKLVVGPVSTPKLKGILKDVLEKWEKVQNPWANRPVAVPSTPRKPPEEPAERQLHPSTCPDVCPFCVPAAEKALRWLVQRQQRDGRWTKLDTEKTTGNEKGQIVTLSIDHVDVALTSLAGLALLSEGSTTKSGAYAASLRRAVDFVAGAVRDDGAVCAERGNDYVFLVHSIFETSLAAVFLAEAQAASPDPERAKDLSTIAQGLARAQDKRSGGWGYGHDANEQSPADKRGWRLLATTHVAMTALNAIRDAGVAIDAEALARGARYVRTCLGRDGTFQYRTETRWADGYAGATAGALFAMARSGEADEAELARWRAGYRRQYRRVESYGEHWWWMALFGALATNDAGQGFGDEYHAYLRDIVLADQKEAGNWDDPDEKAGTVYATSIAALLLQFQRGHLRILGRCTGERDRERVAQPVYLKTPDPTSRVKVFEHEGRYLADLIVSTDGPADQAWLARLADGIRGANRVLYDVTDGQLALHRVRIVTEKREWEQADIRVTTDFHQDVFVPGGGVHGITLVTKYTEIRNGHEQPGRRIGQWIKLPYYVSPGLEMPWDHRGPQRVIAHELCHYLLGVQDEYGACTCFMGDLTQSELCADDDHTDTRRDSSCWTQARTLYPKLVVPDPLDPGPWDPPRPIVEIE